MNPLEISSNFLLKLLDKNNLILLRNDSLMNLNRVDCLKVL